MKNAGLNTIPSVKGHIFNVTVNLIFIAIFYVFLGGLLSWCLWRVFPEYDLNGRSSPIFTSYWTSRPRSLSS